MESLDALMLDLALILIVACIVTLLCKKIHQPVVLGYIIAGFLISPNFEYLPTVVDTADIGTWANIGIVFLMFALGLEFNFKKIADIGSSVVVIALTVMTSMTLIGFLVGTLLGWGRMDSIFLGGMLSMSSTMIILKTYDDLKLKREKFAQLVLGTLIIEDIGGIFMMVILSTIAVGQAAGSAISLVPQLGMMVLFLVLWLALGIYLIPTFLRVTKKYMNDEMLLITSLAICLAMVIVAHSIGFSSALGAFVAGSILSGTVLSTRIEKLVKPVKDLFGAVFFVSVGMMVEPLLLIEYAVPILIIVITAIIGQMTFATIGILVSGNSLHTAIRGGFSMVQIGEFSFIIATLGINLGVTSEFLYPTVVCVSVITIFTTPIFIKNSEKIYVFLNKHLPGRVLAFLRRYTSERPGNNKRDKDWGRYLKIFFTRTVIFGSAIIAVIFLGLHFAKPWVYGNIPGIWGKLILAGGLCLILIPLIIMLLSKRKLLYTKLWMKRRYNQLPLVALNSVRIVMCALAVVYTIRQIFDVSYILILILALVVVILGVRSDFMNGAIVKMEMRFLSNFNEEILEHQMAERKYGEDYSWIDEKLYVSQVTINRQPENKTIGTTLAKSRYIYVTIIKIMRDGKHINMPDRDTEIRKGDILHVLGTRDQIEGYLYSLRKRDHITPHEDSPVTLKEYLYGQVFYEIEGRDQIICTPLPMYSDSEFIKKSIKNCHFRSKYDGFIIGIERDNLPILRPDANTVIQEGDLLWILGTQQMADELLVAGLLEINNGAFNL